MYECVHTFGIDSKVALKSTENSDHANYVQFVAGAQQSLGADRSPISGD